MFRLLSYRSSKVDVGPEWSDVEFSAARYEPMARLLCEEDLLFLKSQPGFRPEMAKKFNRERRRIFRLYLHDLAQDFHRLHARALELAAGLPAEHSPLIGMLLRQKARFWYEIAALELRLSLDLTVAAHARGLVQALASMQAEISMAAAPALQMS